ncbi:MAG: cytochrome C [Deltaproteobacteria bacterium]|nr:cytochrome C [Candidatus Anaeroferrophillus wilburensis]MBN2888544.1 cytochrome C [Deltaproteobacteria bacterium]
MKKNAEGCRMVLAVVLVMLLGISTGWAAGVADTRHNLSVSGPGEIVATAEVRICIFCHTPHHASPTQPLWSRELSGASYDLYASTTIKAQPGQPTGASRLCLSCHDGTVALGLLHDAAVPITMAGGITTLPSSRSTNLQTDLADDHPISFAYTAALAAVNGELRDPATLPAAIKLEEGSQLQCTACHNPHKDPYGKFLVMDNAGAALCVACHDKTGWASSTHATASGVAGQGCNACHVPHNAGGRERLLKSQQEEQNCFPCHDTSGSEIDVLTDFTKLHHHPVEATAGEHDPLEDPLTALYHVECSDCHNPHRLNDTAATPPLVTGQLAGVKGVTIAGLVVAESQYQYEICFRCHADNSFSPVVAIPRQIQEVNERLRFDPANPSYHPVAAIGKQPSVPSLRPEYSSASMIYCSDCHNSDTGSMVGGAGADGVHGSSNPRLLVARYEQDAYPLSYAESNYALCFRCHDPNVLMDRFRSNFPSHRSHVIAKQTPCSVCHDPHGVPLVGGATTTGNAHLINYDSRFVTGTYNSVTRSCTVNCHMMNPRSY